jgi:8-oxo-dGTP pyrophosphatase MutT (NUDIX family)
VKLDPIDWQYLQGLLRRARQPVPAGWQPWYLGDVGQQLGVLPMQRAQALSLAMPANMPLIQTSGTWVWHADSFSASERSCVLQAIALNLCGSDQLRGWRNEAYACWGCVEGDWPCSGSELFRLERAAFRHFGLRSHAAHVHGITEDGRMWCGRRSLNKATDPGLLDNLAAGGIPAGEGPTECAVREIAEEAGMEFTLNGLSCPPQVVLTERAESEGWHSERLFVYTVNVPNHEIPENRDGEVSEFLCLSLPEVLSRIRAGQFAADAACAIALSVLQGALYV